MVRKHAYIERLKVSIGSIFYDSKDNKMVVTKVKYKKAKDTYGYPTKVMDSVTLKNATKKEKQRVATLKQLQGKYKTFSSKERFFKRKSQNNSGLNIGFFNNEKPEVEQKESYLNNLFDDNIPNPMSPIISTIKKQIKKEAMLKRESDVSVMYGSFKKDFHGFIAKTGVFSDFVANIIVIIDWLGNEEKFSAYKEEVMENHKSHNVILINTTNKTKTFFINILKIAILKYRGE